MLRPRQAVRAVLLRLLALVLASLSQAHAQQAAGPPPKPLIPVSASSLSADPEPYYGQVVTMVGAVDRRLSASAFSVDQDRTRSTGNDVLVLAPTLNAPVEVNAYLTVIGEVVRFDPDDISRRLKDYTVDLAPDLVARYRGRPAVLATAVITPGMIDLARRPLPPMTPEEQAYSKVMKRIGPAFNNLRQSVGESKPDESKESADILRQGFTEAEAFWKTRGKADATTWAEDARKVVENVQRAVAAGKWDDAKTAAGTLTQSCQACHTAYRERVDDGTYRFKAAAAK